ncbi:glycoside hydrolase family 127 protein [Rhodohalobacter sp. SW132]|uniref:glycoside hydrolase family 127 protein n=1 Tax=Rhodohalobacter sp. SW132 TaxID=2293433 RepID=UPI001ADF2F12|nr:glycoside hydrolase family 127 protein [Rhodohalobacter sp. SW132]
MVLSIITAALFLYGCNAAEETPRELSPFPLSAVDLIDGPFLHAQNLNDDYVLAHDPDRLLAPFLIDAGLTPKASRYGNWENTGLDGHTAGHYLTTLAMMVAASGNEEARDRLEYMVDQLAICQAENGNGYVGGIPGGQEMWEEIAAGNINAQSFSLNGKWVPWYNIHKLYAGLRDAWIFTENEQALEVLIELTDWTVELVSDLSDNQIQEMLISEHGGMNEVFADVYDITGDERYAELARQFSHREILDPLLNEEDRLTGLHANTQIPKVIGFKRVAEVCEIPSWDDAAAFFWDTVVNHRSVAIGGNSVAEHFHPRDDFSSMLESREGPETCNTYNMMRLARQLYFTSGDLKYIDYYERSLYNHILSSQHPEHGGLVYFSPMRPGHYRVYSNPEHTFWCCVGTGIENHTKYGELVYSHDGENLFVNLFLPTRLDWEERGVTLTQKTEFPESDVTAFTLNMEEDQTFDLNIRHPQWLTSAGMSVEVNGEKFSGESEPGSYFTIDHNWQDGDQIEVRMPMHTYGEYLPDGSPYMAILHGPVVLAADVGSEDVSGLVADDSRMGQVAPGLLYPRHHMPMLVIDDEQWTDKLSRNTELPLSFDVSELTYPQEELSLIPFYRLHDARYIIYWQTGTSEEARQMRDELAKQEDGFMELENQTISRVVPGQQQPESEHNFQGEQTEAGVHQNRHWRKSGAWFSYDMPDPEHEARVLRLTYHGEDEDRHFDILLNDNHIAEVRLDGSEGDQFIDISYSLPTWVVEGQEDGIHTIRFEAKENSETAHIFDVRLMR